ncbi:MAG: hypothetical protein AAGJ95_10195 [Cyanobacteria bacterium J06554_11]
MTPTLSNADRIARAIRWYQANKGRIVAALPMQIDGATFTKRWVECFETNVLSAWNQSPSERWAMIYIVRRLRAVRAVLDTALPALETPSAVRQSYRSAQSESQGAAAPRQDGSEGDCRAIGRTTA